MTFRYLLLTDKIFFLPIFVIDGQSFRYLDLTIQF
jgi:hypothetical protein